MSVFTFFMSTHFTGFQSIPSLFFLPCIECNNNQTILCTYRFLFYLWHIKHLLLVLSRRKIFTFRKIWSRRLKPSSSCLPSWQLLPTKRQIRLYRWCIGCISQFAPNSSTIWGFWNVGWTDVRSWRLFPWRSPDAIVEDQTNRGHGSRQTQCHRRWNEWNQDESWTVARQGRGTCFSAEQTCFRLSYLHSLILV